jgi:hypothetical protein
MINVNLISILYLFFRLAPFIIVCSFLLQSILNSDVKGFVFLLGLIFSIVLIGIIPIPPTTNTANADICQIMDLGFANTSSGIPISTIIYGFTMTFLSTIIIKYKLQSLNWPTFIFFPIMGISDAVWNKNNNCAGITQICLGLLFSVILGGIYAGLLIKYNLLDFQIWNGISSNEICKRPSKTLYKCVSNRDKTKPISVKTETKI